MMAGTITHEWTGTILTITSDSGTSSCDLKGGKGDTGPRGAQGPAGIIVNPDGTIDTSQYATETYVNEKIAQVEAGSVDLSNYYTKAQVDAKIPDVTGLDSQTWVEEKGYLTQHQSLANYALKSEIPDVSQYQTATQVQTLINNALGVIENGTY